MTSTPDAAPATSSRSFIGGSDTEDGPVYKRDSRGRDAPAAGNGRHRTTHPVGEFRAGARDQRRAAVHALRKYSERRARAEETGAIGRRRSSAGSRERYGRDGVLDARAA